MRLSLVFKNTFYQVAARIISSLAGFIITIIIANHFGVLGYGDFTKVTSFVAVFYLLVDFGLNAIFLQEEKHSFAQLFSLRIAMSFLFFIVCNLFTLLLPFSPTTGVGFSSAVKLSVFVFSFTIFTQSIIYSASFYSQKKLSYLYYLIGIIGGSIFNLVVVFIFGFLNFSIFYIFLSFLLSGAFSSLIFLGLVKEKKFEFNLNASAYKSILLKSLPLGLMIIFNYIYFRVDTILLSLFSTSNAVGIYGLSYKFFDFLIAIPLFISNAVYPLLLSAKEDKAGFNNLSKKYFIVFFLLSVVIAIPFWFISPLFSLIKPEFGMSALPFRILLLSLPLFFLTSFLQWILIVLQKQKHLMYIYFLSLILNILLNIIFIPRYSYFASAYITIFSEGLVFIFLIVLLVINRRKQNV
jgi:O-antigen/teichoic acid export membrane protein